MVKKLSFLTIRKFFPVATIFGLVLLLTVNAVFSIPRSGEVTVSVTEQGFLPDFLEIERGTKVTWVNKGQVSHWPATDFHPTHDRYPTQKKGCIGSALDSCRELESNESFVFVFDEVGSWGIHDHMFPSLSMRITVNDLRGPGSVFVNLVGGIWSGLTNLVNAKNLLALSDGDLFRKLNQEEQKNIIKKSAQKYPTETWNYLKKTLIIDGLVVANAHQLAHIIGNELFNHFGARGIKFCDDAFVYGCYHGVTERLVLTSGNLDLKAVEEECLEIYPLSESDSATSCVHGAGHSVFALSAGRLNESLKICDLLQDQYRRYCYDGVFMERNESAPSSDINPQDPWGVCASLAERYQRRCSIAQPQFFLQMLGWDLRQAGAQCDSATDPALRQGCYEGYGSQIAQFSRGELEGIKEKCGFIRTSYGSNVCLNFAVKEIKAQKYPNWERTAISICGGLPQDLKSNCL